MTRLRILLTAALMIVPSCLPLMAHADDAKPATPKVLLDMSEGAEKRVVPTSDQVTVTRSTDIAAPGLNIAIAAGGEGYPGFTLKPEAAPWNLSAFGHVEAKVVNTGTTPVNVSLRVDNAGNWQDNPWNTESVALQPGESGTIHTIFGYAYGHKPNFALNPAAVTNILIFALKSDKPQTFRLESVVAAGPAGEKVEVKVDPNAIRLIPKDGLLLGNGVAIDTDKQIVSHGTQSALNGDTLRVTFPAVKGDPNTTLKIATGRWDLRDYLQARLTVRNDGQNPLIPRVRLESNGGPTDWVIAAPLAPGAKTEIVVPFIAATPANVDKDKIKTTGNHFNNDAVAAVTIAAESADVERVLTVEEIKAELPPTPKMPDWLGQRPPVAGDWVKTLDDNFDGTALDPTVWGIYGPNYWDKLSHFSKDDVLVGDGVVKLRFEKKRGFHNDDPKEKQSEYAAGFLYSYGRFVQRYGYFESRMKLPTSPGLWPAFWMMPDRGADKVEEWKRQSTSDGGMEFDIMEHLTRWRRYRYNIAMHYDGYQKDHKAVGTDKIYCQPDKDGFITCGLLWTPGSAIYYCNGQEVARWENPRISTVQSFLMFTLPMGGWDNDPLDDKKLPDDFIIDYVRVWQRRDLASAVDGKQPQPAPK